MDNINEIIIRSLFHESDVLITEGANVSGILKFIEGTLLSIIAYIIIYKIIKLLRK